MKHNETSTNEGLIQHGGSINAQALAIGPKASASVTGTTSTETSDDIGVLREQVEELIRILRSHAGSTEVAPAAIENATEIARGLDRPHPDKKALLETLGNLGSTFKGLSAISEIVRLITDGIKHLL
jgi:hypothetical protein